MHATPSAPCPALFLPLPADPGRLILFRQWAADVRYCRGPHAAVPAEVARVAGLLAALLGQLQERGDRPGALLSPVEGAVEALVGWLVLRGVRPPGVANLSGGPTLRGKLGRGDRARCPLAYTNRRSP